MGFVRFFPFADVPGARSLPRPMSEDIVRFGSTVPPANRVPSSRFLTVSTGCSVLQAAGLLRPAASHRVHCVLRPMVARAPEAPPKRMSETVGPVERAPQCGSHPPKSSPRQQPYRITAALALLSLLSGALHKCSTPRPGRPPHRRSSDGEVVSHPRRCRNSCSSNPVGRAWTTLAPSSNTRCRASKSVPLPRRSQLQGVAPLTSPL